MAKDTLSGNFSNMVKQSLIYKSGLWMHILWEKKIYD